eukprot:CAMPEP_0184736090 /NCGR_PEP_ID=MMETSP0314-20130426/62225_1 /TAXON_ID=38298 /ORGANISM="Rhodella maculata, Strain CCMP 736" /LENGTH=61 /DNA_ID=CAMNT_0027203147 /DNA_START=323 /DNA_END=508 /DNA_ORIENTATION=+
MTLDKNIRRSHDQLIALGNEKKATSVLEFQTGLGGGIFFYFLLSNKRCQRALSHEKCSKPP